MSDAPHVRQGCAPRQRGSSARVMDGAARGRWFRSLDARVARPCAPVVRRAECGQSPQRAGGAGAGAGAGCSPCLELDTAHSQYRRRSRIHSPDPPSTSRRDRQVSTQVHCTKRAMRFRPGLCRNWKRREKKSRHLVFGRNAHNTRKGRNASSVNPA